MARRGVCAVFLKRAFQSETPVSFGGYIQFSEKVVDVGF